MKIPELKPEEESQVLQQDFLRLARGEIKYEEYRKCEKQYTPDYWGAFSQLHRNCTCPPRIIKKVKNFIFKPLEPIT